MRIEHLISEPPPAVLAHFSDLLIDAVAHGASIGFLGAVTREEAAAYWRKIFADIPDRGRVVFAAFDDTGRLAGTAQLALELRPNGRHRAEVQKVLVWHAARGRGIGAALMVRVEAEARARGRTLLFLDTSIGEAGAVKFYDRLGYALAGGIPDYAANPDGTLVPNVIFYKRLN